MPSNSIFFAPQISTLLKNEADLIAAPLTMTSERFDAVNYAPAIGYETFGLFIWRSASAEELSWMTFLKPLANHLWLTLLASAFLVCIFIQMFSAILGSRRRDGPWDYIGNSLETYLVLICAYFAKKAVKFPGGHHERTDMFKVILLSTLFWGNVVFMAYRASLTSELSARRSKLPFTNLEEFLGSNYR